VFSLPVVSDIALLPSPAPRCARQEKDIPITIERKLAGPVNIVDLHCLESAVAPGRGCSRSGQHHKVAKRCKLHWSMGQCCAIPWQRSRCGKLLIDLTRQITTRHDASTAIHYWAGTTSTSSPEPTCRAVRHGADFWCLTNLPSGAWPRIMAAGPTAVTFAARPGPRSRKSSATRKERGSGKVPSAGRVWTVEQWLTTGPTTSPRTPCDTRRWLVTAPTSSGT